MFEYLERLRKKPEAERRRFGFIVSIVITGIIGIIWAITTTISIKNTDFSIKKDPSDAGSPGIRETFTNIFDTIGEVFEKGEPEAATTTEPEFPTY